MFQIFDDDVTMDPDSDNLDEQQDECIDEGDSEMARGSAKARSLARAAIAQADHQEKDENEVKNDNQPVGDGEKPDENNASTEDVRAMWGDSYGDATVSTHVLTVVQQTLEAIERIQETHEKEKKEAEQREMRLKNQITEMSDKLTGLMTLMERQAIEMEKGRGEANELRSSFAEYRTEAGDREVRYTRQISNLKTQISTLEGKMNEMTAEAEKSEHRLSTALAKLKQQSQTPKSQKASDTPTPGVHSAHTGNPKRRDMIEKLPEAVVDAKQTTDEIRTLSNCQDKPETTLTPENAQKTNPETSDEKRKEGMQSVENNEWVDTSKRRRKKLESKESAPEQQPSKPLGKLLGAPGIKRKGYFVGGIHPECAAEDLRQFCETRSKVIKCTQMPARKLGTQCAHVVVTADTAEAFEATKWEEHIFCRPWRFSSNSD